MSGGLKHFGFIIPFSVAFNFDKDPPRDSTPRPGRCSFCHGARSFMYRLGDERWMCSYCLADSVRVSTRRVAPQRRPIDPLRPIEVAYEHMARKPDAFEARRALWDRWLD